MIVTLFLCFSIAFGGDRSEERSGRKKGSGHWEGTGRVERKEGTTGDFDSVRCGSILCNAAQTGVCSPDGKWCAGLTSFKFNLTNPDLRYKFYPRDQCLSLVQLLSGPAGWYDLSDCHYEDEQGSFYLTLRTWTSTQSFRVGIPIERWVNDKDKEAKK
jgi:hypothetical protein